MLPVLNISAYQFVTIDDPESLRPLVHAQASQRALLGTVLLATEGVNLFLAGAPHDVNDFVQWLREDERFSALPVKESASHTLPFRRLMVKVKPEIIRMNQPAICPQQGRAPALEAAVLARWLDQGHDDQGRPVVLLDTRNAFEVDQGRFDGAVDWRLSKFSDFPAALNAHADSFRGKTVVSYCTGGIRCEKAALWMRDAGVDSVLQLEGGILKYFETVGQRHFSGHCFVFDERVALDSQLKATVPAGAVTA